MTTQNLEQQLIKINQKLDSITKELVIVRQQREEWQELKQDLTIVGKDVFNDTLEKLDEFDQKGYFQFVKELIKVGDRVVEYFSEEDIKQLGENIITILETAKNLTQPEMLSVINNATTIYKKLDTANTPQYSIWKVMRELKTPEMQKGMGFIITFLKNITNDNPLNKGVKNGN